MLVLINHDALSQSQDTPDFIFKYILHRSFAVLLAFPRYAIVRIEKHKVRILDGIDGTLKPFFAPCCLCEPSCVRSCTRAEGKRISVEHGWGSKDAGSLNGTH